MTRDPSAVLRAPCSVFRDDDDGDDGMVKGKGKKEKQRDMDPLYKITHVGFPVGQGCKL